jgi:hypothetical protein
VLQLSTIIEVPSDGYVPYAFETEDAEFSARSTSAAARGTRKFVVSVKTAPADGRWSQWVEFGQSDDEAEAGVGAQFLRLANGVDVQVAVELCGYTRHVFLQPVHRIEVRASSVRDRIGAAGGGKESEAASRDKNDDEVSSSSCLRNLESFLSSF